MTTAAPLDYVPLATVEDMQDGPYKYMLTGGSASYLENVMVRASRRVESRCGHRFVPFTGITHTEYAEGVPMPEGSPSPGIALPLGTTMSLSRATALGSGAGWVRDVWLDEFAPQYPELWTYSDVSVSVSPPIGGGPVPVGAAVEGPYPDTGQLRLPVYTYCPPGSLITVVYGGGYTVSYPDDLVQAAMMQAAKTLILALAPERRSSGLSTSDLEAEIVTTLGPYGCEDDANSTKRGRHG